MREALKERKVEVLGSVPYDPEILNAGLIGTYLRECEALEDVKRIVERLEERVL